MSNAPSSLNFTNLVEPAGYVTQSPPAEPFDAGMAYLLGQCCGLTYSQYDTGKIRLEDFSSLDLAGSLQGYSIAASNLQAFHTSEANGPLPTTGEVGDYLRLPAGFGVQLTLTPSTGQPLSFVVIALRGTRTWDEWLNDVEAYPTPFAGEALSFGGDGLGSVHGGFYSLYTIGVEGATAQPGDELSSTLTDRATGSIAQKIGYYVNNLSGQPSIYVTGHSLGGALATLCALDIAHNFPHQFSQISMYSLASPRVAAGIPGIPTMGNQVTFVSNYQSLVPNSYQIVHSADIVPILPSLYTQLGPLVLNCLQITESGATATASVTNGGVSAVTVSSAVGYSSDFPPNVIFSGGGGTGATATVTVQSSTEITVTVNDPGSGYTSAPAVELLSTGPIPGNVVSFCAQTGDVANNHSCTVTYLPYLQQLANGL